MEEGQNAQQHVIGRDLRLACQRGVSLHHICDQIAVGEQDPLGQPRGTARVGHDQNILGGFDLHGRELSVALQQRCKRGRALGLAKDEDLLN